MNNYFQPAGVHIFSVDNNFEEQIIGE